MTLPYSLMEILLTLAFCTAYLWIGYKLIIEQTFKQGLFLHGASSLFDFAMQTRNPLLTYTILSAILTCWVVSWPVVIFYAVFFPVKRK